MYVKSELFKARFNASFSMAPYYTIKDFANFLPKTQLAIPYAYKILRDGQTILLSMITGKV